MSPSNNQAAGQSHLSFGAMSFPDLTSLKIGPPVASKKGGVKQCPISLNGKPLQFILGTVASPLRVPFEVARFNSEDSLARLHWILKLSTVFRKNSSKKYLSEYCIWSLRTQLNSWRRRLQKKHCLLCTNRVFPKMAATSLSFEPKSIWNNLDR